MKALVTAIALMSSMATAQGDEFRFTKHQNIKWNERDKPAQIIADCQFLHFQSKYCSCVAQYFPFDMKCFAEFFFVARAKEEDVLSTPRPRDHKPYTILMIRKAQTVDMTCTERSNNDNG